ncbi:MAG: ABC transporter substrate-binding protein, partial [Planctomycetes bacterium]|nr:ABC transporter substrate-binding protein [Planctomycetota bacterium]
DLTRSIERRPKVVCLEWLDPPWVAGHWVPEMVEMAGGEDLLGRAGEPSFPVEWESVVRAAPEVLVVMPCGFGLERTREEVGGLRKPPGFESIPATRDGRVFLVDANAHFSRPGPRIVGGLEILVEILHPEIAAGVAPAGSFARP